MARAYLLRAGHLALLLHEDTIGRALEALADPELARSIEPHRWIPVSCFHSDDPPRTVPPLEVEIQRGDRLIFAVGANLVQALDDPARAALLAAPEPDVVAGLSPTEGMVRRGWGLITVDIDAG